MTRLKPRGGRPIYLTPLGLHSRYMLGAYLRHILMVAGALMTIALTIDLWPQVALLSADPARGGPLLILDIAWLALLRLPDLFPPLLPFATFLGVVWSESAFTESRERLLVWNSGRSPLLCLAPAAMAGVVMGASLFILDGLLRPTAIHVQMAQVLGREGIRLDRSLSGGNHWIALPDGVMRAQIEYGPPVRLHNVTVYKLDREGHLAEVDTAATATALNDGQWLLEKGRYWRADFENRGDVLTTGETEREVEIPFTQRTIALNLDPLWLHNKGLSPQYLWWSDLRTLTGAQIMSRDLSGYRTRFQALLSGPFFTCSMALLGAALSMLYFAYQTRWQALVLVLLTGYLAHFAYKALYLMGEFGYIPAIVAGWLPTLLLSAGVAAVVLTIQKRRGLGLRLRETPKFADEA